jgi:two-component system phosphate regulon sensor histidine kinase PhoR
MKIRNFRLVFVLMSLALPGLVLLQAYWIQHDLKLKEQQFNQSVVAAMTDMVEKVERLENKDIIVRRFMNKGDSTWTNSISYDTTYNSVGNLLSSQRSSPPGSVVNEIAIALKDQIKNLNKKEFKLDAGELGRYSIDTTIDIRIEKDVQEKEVFAIQLANEEALFDSLATATEQRVQTRLRKLNTLMQQYTLQIGNHSQKIFERLDTLKLDSIVNYTLSIHGINQPVILGISNFDNSKLLYANPSPKIGELKKSNFRIPLFPNDFFKRTEQLVLTFPEKTNYLFYSIWPLLLTSFVLTLTLIVGFVYTLSTILRQKKLAEIKNDFINNMTHEFKTPIATISIANQSIQDPRIYSSVDKLTYYTGIIRDENQRMLNQVETVLQMAQLDKGELNLKLEIIRIDDLLLQAASSVQLQVEQKNGRLITNLNCDDVYLNCDGNHLLNVFTNLLDNANKYSPQDPFIAIESNFNTQFVIVKISDKGVGMSKDDQKRIFDIFYRVSTGDLHNVKGFGLGLSYVKAIVERHNGTVEVKSELGKGSTFIVTLPIAK